MIARNPNKPINIVSPERVDWVNDIEVIGDLDRIKLLETREEGEYFKTPMIFWLLANEDKTIYGPLKLAQAKRAMLEFPNEYKLARELCND